MARAEGNNVWEDLSCSLGNATSCRLASIDTEDMGHVPLKGLANGGSRFLWLLHIERDGERIEGLCMHR